MAILVLVAFGGRINAYRDGHGTAGRAYGSGHECLDRVYLNAYVPILQSSGQMVPFMTQHLGKPTPVSRAEGAHRHAVPQGGGVLRGRERDPVGEVRQGRPQHQRDAAA